MANCTRCSVFLNDLSEGFVCRKCVALLPFIVPPDLAQLMIDADAGLVSWGYVAEETERAAVEGRIKLERAQ